MSASRRATEAYSFLLGNILRTWLGGIVVVPDQLSEELGGLRWRIAA